MIDSQSIESLKNSINIVDVVGNFIELRKAGANYKANCPFHGEKTPSLVVSPTKQIFHCFGCGIGGDSIKFVMEIEKLSYPEAIEKLASMHNFSLQYTKGSHDHSQTKRLLETIQHWYTKNLDQHPHAREYLLNRGIAQNSIERFGIGYVPRSKEVMDFLHRSLLPLPNALEAGVVAQSDDKQRFYPRLIERITFPIYTPSGSIVGFGGRTITNHPAKYINSPQTKLFNKSRLLYGYHLAKEAIYQSQRIIICEGYLDVVMFHQAGFNEAVASMGTALTPDHLPLLRKGEPKVLLAYDGDKAGIAAALKASHMLSIAGFEGGVALFGNGEDPADLIAQGRVQEVANLLHHPKPLIAFVLEQIIASHDLHNPHDKERAFEESQQYLNNLTPIIKDLYTPVASTLLGISPDFFKSARTPHQPPPTTTQSQEDIAQLSLIKTLMLSPELITPYHPYISLLHFGNYQPLLDAIFNDQLQHPQLLGLSIDETYKVMSKEEFHHSVVTLVIKFCHQKLVALNNHTTILYTTKTRLIRQIKSRFLPQLNKGELLTLDLSPLIDI
jgi:DNA primase